MKRLLIKKNGKTYVQLPAQFDIFDEIEIFQLRDNFWLISSPLEKNVQEKPIEKYVPNEIGKKIGKKLSDDEKLVLRELLKIRFADRTPLKIEKLFSPEKQNLVRQLLKKGFVQIFYGRKYQKTGVYNIKDDIYPLINQSEPKEDKIVQKIASRTQSVPLTYSELLKIGWLIISNPQNAELFSSELKKIGVAQNVKGVRAFDGRFYIATNKFLYFTYEKIKSIMEKKTEMHIEEIVAATNLEPESVLVVLNILAESGEITERKKGLFCLV